MGGDCPPGRRGTTALCRRPASRRPGRADGPGGGTRLSARPVPRNQILVGDVRTRLAELPDAAVDCVITSPPYWALRDYGHGGQIGAEANVEAWAAEIAA